MASLIDYELIDINYPVPGKDNSTQGMRNNFTFIQQALLTAHDEISTLQTLLETTTTNLPILREDVSVTTSSLASNASQNHTVINGVQGYFLYKIVTSHDAWVRIYTDTTSRTADSGRLFTDTVPVNTGVIADAKTTANVPYRFTPAVFGFNDEDVPIPEMYITVTNKSGAAATINVTLTILPVED